MEYSNDIIKPVFKKLNMPLPDELTNDILTKVDITHVLFCKLGWSASKLIEIFRELDKHDGFENIYGDGI